MREQETGDGAGERGVRVVERDGERVFAFRPDCTGSFPLPHCLVKDAWGGGQLSNIQDPRIYTVYKGKARKLALVSRLTLSEAVF